MRSSLCLAAALCTAALSFYASAQTAAPAMVGKVFSLKGEAQILRAEHTQAVQKGSDIFPNDTISTSDGGIVEIRFDDMSVITIGSASSLTIDAFVYNPKSPDADQSTLRMTTGFFHFVSGKVAREKVRIDTPVSTIGIRGTALAGEVMNSGKTMVSLVKCCVQLENESGVSQLTKVGTYSEIGSRRAAPSAAAETPAWWADKAVAALGKTHEMLGLKHAKPAVSGDAQAEKDDSSAKENRFELGPNNRRSFPYIK